ncbi:hypothetical protein [Anaeromicropila herbilytica]|uniref:Uncharacterized protein n=1 Tax=Anaeromicropila herbilytica TaxID=2785025 RepID=A0A7R7IBP3_9FIRM|nr:hypothetical protein [Anaeromicropila herbilytica]BCN29029.1 hypothetical protein bsdtb5_03240 [Anaeromicropila herbilytica]
MKTWNNPELLTLNVKFTREGSLGGDGDGVHYDVFGRDVIGTSGPAIDDPNWKKKP